MLRINKKLFIGMIGLCVITLVMFVLWLIIPSSDIHNKVKYNNLKVNKSEYLELIKELQMNYSKNPIKFIDVTLLGDTPNKEDLVFWRPDIKNPSGFIDGCEINPNNDDTSKKVKFYINTNHLKLNIANINRNLNNCIGHVFIENRSDSAQLNSLQKYLNLSGKVKKILFLK